MSTPTVSQCAIALTRALQVFGHQVALRFKNDGSCVVTASRRGYATDVILRPGQALENMTALARDADLVIRAKMEAS